MIIWGRQTVRKQGQGECGGLWRVFASALKVLWALHRGPPNAMENYRPSFQLSSFSLFLWEGLRLPQWFWATRWCIKWSYGTTDMHTPKHEGLPWFSFRLDVILSPRDPGNTSQELAEPRAANFLGFCQVSFKRMCGDARAPVLISQTQNLSKEMGVGERPGAWEGAAVLLSSLLIQSGLDAPACQGQGRCKQFQSPPGCSI